jgi:hypothetical protein
MKAATGAGFVQPRSRLERLNRMERGYSGESPKQNAPRLNRVWGVLLFAEGRLLRGIFDRFAVAFCATFIRSRDRSTDSQSLAEDTKSIKKAFKRVFVDAGFFAHDDKLAIYT